MVCENCGSDFPGDKNGLKRFCDPKCQKRAKYLREIERQDRARVAVLDSQDHACAICKKPLTVKQSRFDHDHNCCSMTTNWKDRCGKCERGILCHGCNLKLGWYERHAETINSYLGVKN
jgi:hypothetical protein